MIDQEKFYEALCEGSMDKVKELTQKALNEGEAPEKVLKGGLIPAMDRIGVRFRSNDFIRKF